MALTQTMKDHDRFMNAMSGDDLVLHPMMRRVRAQYNGVMIADTEDPVLAIEFRDPKRRARDAWENRPWMGSAQYYWPQTDVLLEHLVETDEIAEDARIGRRRFYDIRVGNRMIRRAAWNWFETTEEYAPLQTRIALSTLALDALYEEEDEIGGVRNPYHAVECRRTSRHVRIVVDGVELASSTRAVMLFETGLPTRFYLPKQDVDMTLLRSSDLVTRCPYKGECEYWDVSVAGNTRKGIVWSYTHPYPNASKIEHLLGFYEERGMTIYVDGVERPTPGVAFPDGFMVKPDENADSTRAGVDA